jgi:altronate dehydratase
MPAVPLTEVARLPEPADNVAIATRSLEAGLCLQHGDYRLVLDRPILEGHRFATERIAPGELLTSWHLPFGKAIRLIEPGAYVCNRTMLKELSIRRLNFELPSEPNFEDFRQLYQLNPERFQPAQQVPRHERPGTFLGFARGEGRGIGTRNYIAVMGTSSRTASYARALAEKFRAHPAAHFDGVVAIAHTEGGGSTRPNNFELTLRTLAGFMVHPNIGAILAVAEGNEPINNERLLEYLNQHRYPIQTLPHRFMRLQQGFEASLAQGEAIVRSWIDRVSAMRRTTQPLSGLNIGLQCGGSDAFSGVSANPLVGWISKELVRHGGSANLAETPELIGAETYVLQNVRDLKTARMFLDQLERFQQWAAWHGHSAEGNPSGGNLYRGLYNIVIKSIGAARKKDPQVRLDYCIEFGQPMTEPGFCFMDSPGNDLENRQRFHHQFPLRAHHQDCHHHRALPIAPT